MTRTPLMAGNWKMNLTHLEAIALVQKLVFALPERYYGKVDVAVLPSFTNIRSIQTMIEGDDLGLVHGAQDVSPHDHGPYTGDVSGPMLAKLGCRYVVVGHSERREHHHEDDALVAAKLRATLENGMTPILCIGEGLPVREQNGQVEHCVAQLDAALRRVPAEQVATSVIAYEPIWAIGTGRVATPADAQEVCGALRARVTASFGAQAGDGVRVLYGGSAKANNIGDIVAKPDVDGALVGGASLDADEFATMCAIAAGGPLR